MTEGSALYCRVCRRAVNVWTKTVGGQETITYLHKLNEQVDHTIEPVDVTELVDPLIECDFCSIPSPLVIYVCGESQYANHRVVNSYKVGLGDYHRRHEAARKRSVEYADGPTDDMGREWTACESCAVLFDEGAMPQLITRVLETMPLRMSTKKQLQRRADLYVLYAGIQNSLIARVPIDEWLKVLKDRKTSEGT